MKVEAIYYDNTDKPYRVERKYFFQSGNSVLYVRITDDEIVSVRQKYFNHKDTTIFQEEYSSIKRRKTKADILSESIMGTSSEGIGDTSIFTYYLYNDSTLIDTVFPGKESRVSSASKKETELVSKILSNEFRLSLDSLTLDETVKTYSVKGQIVKSETISPDNFVYYVVSFSNNKKPLTSKSIFSYKDSVPKLIRADSISWTRDKSEIIWIENRLDWKKKYITKYSLKGATLQVFDNDTLYKQIEYLDNPNLFNLVFTNNITYDDKLYSIDLLQFDERKELKIIFPKEQTIINEYKTDNKKRIIEQKQFRNKKLFRRVTYSYVGQ